MKKEYVVGFLFNAMRSRVLLIRKTHPEWQAGLLNGIGGRVESKELPIAAMKREFIEEVNDYDNLEWERFLTLYFDHAIIHFFVADRGGTFEKTYPRSPTNEKLEVFDVCQLLIARDIVHNIRLIIPLAVDFLNHH